MFFHIFLVKTVIADIQIIQKHSGTEKAQANSRVVFRNLAFAFPIIF